jgi:hypothetical protein
MWLLIRLEATTVVCPVSETFPKATVCTIKLQPRAEQQCKTNEALRDKVAGQKKTVAAQNWGPACSGTAKANSSKGLRNNVLCLLRQKTASTLQLVPRTAHSLSKRQTA